MLKRWKSFEQTESHTHLTVLCCMKNYEMNFLSPNHAEIFWFIPFFFLSLCVLVLWLEFASLARVYYKFITHHISYMSHELNKGTCGKTVPVIQWTGWQIWLHKWFFELMYTSFHYLQIFLLKCFFFKEWFFQLVGGDHMKTKYPKSKSDSSLFMHNIFFVQFF